MSRPPRLSPEFKALGTFEARNAPIHEPHTSLAQSLLAALVLAAFVASVFMLCWAYSTSVQP